MRIIIDIGIHAGGIRYDEIKKFMNKYLAMSDKSIESEIYRYIVLPGQALGYKIGEMIIKHIHKKLIKSNDYLSDESFELYKQIIYDKAMPFDLLLKKYDIKLNDIFL
jgi:uncharacterized protein (DUF885 family)